MNKLHSLKKYIVENKLFLGIVTLLFIGIYFMNSLYPIYIDDWSYTFKLGDDGNRISGIKDIFVSQYNHYFEWGGRSVVHVIAQYLLYIDKVWADLLNSIAYVALVLIIYFIAKGKQKHNISLFLLINVFLWFFIPSLGECIFWKTGSANYLWGGFIIISFLAVYCRHYYKDTNENSVQRSVHMFLFGIIAGWTNENMFVAAAFFVIGIIILYHYQKINIPLWAIFGLAGLLIGGIVMLAAPGNYIRNEITVSGMGASDESKILFYFYRLTSIAKSLVEYALYPFLIYFLLLLIYLKKGVRENVKETLSLSLLFFLTAMVATVVMAAAPIFPHRVWFGIVVFIAAASAILFVNLGFSDKWMKVAQIILLSLSVLLFAYSYTRGMISLYDFKKKIDERERYIEIEKGKGVDNIIIEGKIEYDYPPLTRPYISDLPLDSVGWLGRAYGKYMGVRSITVVDTLADDEK